MLAIRPFQPTDTAALVRLSLRAWEPVFASLERVLGGPLFRRLHPDWRVDQQRAVEAVCRAEEMSVWDAEVGSAVAGFVALKCDAESRIGEIYMVAVDPEHQRHGIGAALTDFTLDQLTQAGMTVAMVETGGDPGHAPARALYERSGCTLRPVARYFRPL
jgi:ribosomal protein S18 acetylase RimI-like enzyme